MKIAIIGAGKVGSTLAFQLAKENHDIVVIDVNEDRLNDLQNQIDIITICGNGASIEILREAEVASQDLVIAATSADEANILACFVARQLGALKTIARVRNPEYRSQLEMMKEELGLSMIVNPERTAAHEISRILRFPSANDVEIFCRGHVELVSYKISGNTALNNISLKNFYQQYKIKVLVCAVRRGEETIIPKGDFILKEGDRISITASPKNMTDFFKAIGALRSPVHSVMIIGGSTTAYYLAYQLAETGVNVKVIERNPERAGELAEKLPKATVVSVDATEQDILLEEGMMDMDAMVALTGLDEMNIIYCMYGKAKGVKKVIAKVNHIAFPEVIEKSGIESVVSPKQMTAERIISYVRAVQNSYGKNKVESLRRIVDNRVEALEFIIKDEEEYINIPFKELNFKEDVLIAAIVRHGATIIPGGNDVILRGDSVIVVTSGMTIDEFSDVLR